MTLDEAVAALAEAGRELPREAMQWLLDHWDDAAPRLVAMLDSYATGSDCSAAAAEVLFFAAHLFGQRNETRAFPALCRLLQDGEAAEEVLGDAVTETLHGILIGTFDGDVARLQAVVDDAATDDFIRDAALSVMAYLTRTGRIPEPPMRALLSRLVDRLDPEIDELLLCGAVMCIAHLGYEDFTPRIEALFRRPAMAANVIMELRHFHEALAESLADPTGVAGFEKDFVRPLTDAIGELSTWSGFSGDGEDAPEDIDLDPDDFEPAWEANQPYINPFRHVGRNDPCPCGSGKKFKKCCLAA